MHFKSVKPEHGKALFSVERRLNSTVLYCVLLSYYSWFRSFSFRSYRFQEKTTKECLHLLAVSGIPYGPINDVQQVFEDPQVSVNMETVRVVLDLKGYLRCRWSSVLAHSKTNTRNVTQQKHCTIKSAISYSTV